MQLPLRRRLSSIRLGDSWVARDIKSRSKETFFRISLSDLHAFVKFIS